MSTGFDISTASYDNVSLEVNSEDTSADDVAFSTNGTKMFMIGSGTDKIFQYSLSTGFDISTASYDNVNLATISQNRSPEGFTFKPDGTKMYTAAVYYGGHIYQYSLSTSFDLSTASYDSVSFSTNSEEPSCTNVVFKPDGTKMFVTGYSGAIYQYSLSTGFDISTASYDNVSFSVSSQELYPKTVVFYSEGNKMLVIGSNSDRIFQYSIG